MLISVITVCFNAEKEIGKTIASVLAQDADFYEYLIIDGASTDRTMEIVHSFRAAFEAKGIRYIVESGKDTGIYNAMNKGARLSSGEWLLFMNAGDRFIHPETLKKFHQPLSEGDAQVVYGSTVLLRGDRMLDYPPFPIEQMTRRQPVCHQSTFIRASLLKRRPYDEKYRGCGDYDFFFWAYRQGVKFQRVDEYVSLFSAGGYSTKHRYTMEREKLQVRLANGAIRRRHYCKRLAILMLQRALSAFMTEEVKWRQESRRLDEIMKNAIWVKSEYEA